MIQELQECYRMRPNYVDSFYINSKMSEEQLPPVNYRISSDYGRIYFGVSHSSSSYDIFGHPMNVCSGINRLASPNSMIIGDNLYKIIKSFPSSSSPLTDYQFEIAGKYLIGQSKDVYRFSPWQGGNIRHQGKTKTK